MSIRTKTLTFISLIFLILVIVLYAFSHIILLQSYEELEQAMVERNVQLGVNALEAKIAFYHNTGMDWAHWDDTYAYIEDHNEKFIESNIYTTVFEYYDLDFMIFVNTAGEIIYSQGYDSSSQELVPLSENLTQLVSHNETLSRPGNEQDNSAIDGMAGIVLLPESNLILATTPILPSNLEGEIRGALIWGRYLNDELVENFAKETQLTLSISSITPAQAEANSNPLSQDITVDSINNDFVTGSILLNDLYGTPALTLNIEMPRSIYQQGQQSIAYFLLSLILVGTTLAGTMMVLLEKGVLSRIAYLNTYVSQIQATKDMSLRLNVVGNDELTNLSNNINTMLDTLQTQEKIKLAHDQAVEAARLKAEILANLSHDARTPLTVILMRAEMLTREIYGPLTPKQHEVLQGMMTSSYQLLGFMNNMLEGARLESGNLKLEIGDLEPARLLDLIKITLHLPATVKNLNLETELSDDVPKVLRGDEKRLDRVLANLVSNAIKFTEQGTVRVRIYRADAEHWALEVKDTGAGISPEHQQQIFIPFWQVDGSHTRPTNSGVGLGLSIVHQLTELMGGSIKVESTLNVGSTFTVVLPIQLLKKEVDHEGKTLHLSH